MSKDSIFLSCCPFCNGYASFRTWRDHADPTDESYTVKCDVCGVETDLYSSKAEAAAHWNHREGRYAD